MTKNFKYLKKVVIPAVLKLDKIHISDTDKGDEQI